MEMQHSFGTFANFNQRNDEEMSSFGSSGIASGFSSPFTSASSTASCSSFSSSFNSPFNSSASNLSSPSIPTSSTPGRMKEWKNRKHREGTNTNSTRNRRDEIVARFRGISLSEFPDDEEAKLPKWDWDDCVNSSWDLKVEPSKPVPWYIYDDSLTWDQFLELSEIDRRDRESQYFQNETMHDLEAGDDYPTNHWMVKTELLIGQLINTPNLHDMMCPACHHYALIIKFKTLVCTVCLKYYPMPSTALDISVLKEGIKLFENKHAMRCPRTSASYGIFNGDIAIICDYCQLMYNISKNF
ncbi:uncharacterized protein LOC107362089 [Tetranychus urticae]|uniref:Uncharacterized protein n=1 Tax=Tetranychus urticae TaxID=32264 RepID=T1K9U9_TETUR|nr:uncharacterized protein LOC107362089 [Tetranychus urticae]